MAFTNSIQFLGLILIVTNSPDVPNGLNAILPIVERHHSFIAYPSGSATVAPLPPGTRTRPVGSFDDAKGKKWNYIELDGETVEFNDAPSTVEKPIFLTHLNDDCCRAIGSVRKSFLPTGDQHAANVFVKSGDVGWSTEGDRIDTVIDVTTASPLVITGKNGRKDNFTLTFTSAAEVVIGNFNLSTIGGPAGSDTAAHFNNYYRMVTFGGLCSATIKLVGGCSPHFSPKKKPAVITTRGTTFALAAQPSHHGSSQSPLEAFFTKGLKKINVIKGVEIDCSNTQYP